MLRSQLPSGRWPVRTIAMILGIAPLLYLLYIAGFATPHNYSVRPAGGLTHGDAASPCRSGRLVNSEKKAT
jgi:hypothetical protein